MYMGHEDIIKEFSMIRFIKEHLNIDLCPDEVRTLRNEIHDSLLK